MKSVNFSISAEALSMRVAPSKITVGSHAALIAFAAQGKSWRLSFVYHILGFLAKRNLTRSLWLGSYGKLQKPRFCQRDIHPSMVPDASYYIYFSLGAVEL
jgi:hypothetical protein